MTTPNYKLDTTNDLPTSRTGLSGLLAVAGLMNSIGSDRHIDRHFPASSNRALKSSQIIQIFILRQREGSFHLDDVRLPGNDEVLLQGNGY